VSHFQHKSAKHCGKAGSYFCNLLLTNRFYILHCIGCERDRAPHSESASVKTRLDKLLVERGITASRERAQALILAGKVLVNEQKIAKAGASVESDSALRLLGEDVRYVSRGGLKLEKALEHWRIDLNGRVCLDIGASTGGFTDCMLQHGAARVIAVDTGYGQMDFRLRADPRVRILEKTNARYLTQDEIGEAGDFIAMDVSFISATLVLPAVICASWGARPGQPERPTARQIVVLVKPQFEVGRELVGKGGIVRDESAQLAAVDKVAAALRELRCTRSQWIDSPILGMEGNREFLLYGELEEVRG
jgi:23S rRNA (cytidine1920-2'-O)/16S rRNA (cytidine1409-2'-O)-methyltransferase